MKNILEWIGTIVFSLVLVIFLQSQVFAITQVNMSSMEDTLYQGQLLVLDKISYRMKAPQKGDIVVFLEGEVVQGFKERIGIVIEDLQKKLRGQSRMNRYIKRVIGTPGDTVIISNGQVYINGELLQEIYIKGDTKKGSIDYPLEVPEGKVFVMGDNRPVSKDSRMFGLVDYKSIEGKAFLRIWPLDKIGKINGS